MVKEILTWVGALPLPALWIAQVLLPLVGFPISPLWIATGIRAGTVLGGTLTVVALALNQALGYWLARTWLRGPIEARLKARGMSVPVIPAGEEALWILLVRVTPGVPLFLQNYLLGLARVRFSLYLAISLPAQMAYAVAFVSLGQAFKDSNVWRGMLAVSGVVAVLIVVVLIRKVVSRRIPNTSPK
jgi:uncharacterized membrane protein YdjX (TVP38/TMEM64 family)